MMKNNWLALLAAVVLVGCTLPTQPTGEGSSARGVLPGWLFAYNGHLVRPDPGTYQVYAGSEISGNPQFRVHLERVLAEAASLTGNQVRFHLVSDPGAPIKIRIDPNDQLFAGNTHLGASILLVRTDYRCVGVNIVIRNSHEFSRSVPLHEFGHLLFGPGHSSGTSDIMNPNRSDQVRLSFSPEERTLWAQSLAYAPGTVQ